MFYFFFQTEQSSPTEEMASANEVDYKTATSIYDFTVKDTYGKDVSLEKYRGFVVLVVNIASQCGLTKNNYAKLTQLHKDYYDKGKINVFVSFVLHFEHFQIYV